MWIFENWNYGRGFQLFGKQPSLKDMLKSLDREGAILFAMPSNIPPGSGVFIA